MRYKTMIMKKENNGPGPEIEAAQTALRNSEKQYRELVQNVHSIIIRWDRGGVITFFNKFGLAFFGYTEAEVMGRHVGLLLPETESTGRDLSTMTDDIARHPEHYSTSINENIRKDGSRVWISWTNHPVLDENGRVTEVFAAGIDITDQIKSDIQVRNQNAVLLGINRILNEALTCETEEQLGNLCLNVAEALTQSDFGFIGEISPDGLLHELAISDPGWLNCAMHSPSGHRRLPADFKIHGLYGRVLAEGKSLFTNDPTSHPDSIGLPQGHPPLTAFLGTPLLQEGRTVGMIALANRHGGYSRYQEQVLEAIAPAVIQALYRKRAEKALHEHEVLLNTVVDALPIGLVIVDPEGRIIRDNAASRELWGIPPETTSWEDYGQWTAWRPESGERIQSQEWAMTRALQNGETVRNELLVNRKFNSDEHRFFLHNAVPLRNTEGDIIGGVAAMHDVTDRMMAELAMRKSESKYRALFENSPDGIFIGFPDGSIETANPAACALLGRSVEELRGLRRPDIVDTTDPRLARALEERLRTGVVYGLEIPAIHKNGQKFPVEIDSFILPGDPPSAFVIMRDITERKKAEAEIEALSRQRQLALDAAGMGWWRYDPETRTTFYDDRCRAIFGVSGDRQPYKEIRSLVHPEDRAGVLLKLQAAMNMADPKPYSAVYRITTPAGTEKWIEANGLAQFEGSGKSRKATGFVGTAADVTAMKNAETALRESEQRFRLALRNAPVSIAVQDIHLKYTWAYNLRTATVEEVIGKSDADIFIPEEARMLTELKTHALEKGVELRRQIWLYRPKGRIFLDAYIEPIRDPSGQVTGLGMAMVDLTALKLAEEEARESRAKLQAALAGMTDALSISDADGYFIDFNDAFARFYRFRNKEDCSRIFAEYPDILEISRADGSPAPPDMWAVPRALRGETVSSEEYILRRKDTGETWVGSFSFGPVYGENGEIVGSVVVARDITDRKRAEERLVASLKEKEVLLKEIHHRVKNNMQIISSLVALQADEAEDAVHRSLLDDVTHRVRSMAMVHEKLYQSEDLARVEFDQYIKSLLEYLFRAYGTSASGIRLKLDLEPVLLPVNTAIPCGLILNELVGNAFKHAFADKTGGELIISLRTEAGGKIRLAVRDSGVGLPAGFDLNKAQTLGLRLVQMLVRQLRGELEISHDHGTELMLTFRIPKT